MSSSLELLKYQTAPKPRFWAPKPWFGLGLGQKSQFLKALRYHLPNLFWVAITKKIHWEMTGNGKNMSTLVNTISHMYVLYHSKNTSVIFKSMFIMVPQAVVTKHVWQMEKCRSVPCWVYAQTKALPNFLRMSGETRRIERPKRHFPPRFPWLLRSIPKPWIIYLYILFLHCEKVVDIKHLNRFWELQRPTWASHFFAMGFFTKQHSQIKRGHWMKRIKQSDRDGALRNSLSSSSKSEFSSLGIPNPVGFETRERWKNATCWYGCWSRERALGLD